MRALGESLIHMPFSQSKYIKFQKGMRRRIESLRPKAEESLDLAVDTMMQERVDSFFRVEHVWSPVSSLSKTDGTISTARFASAPAAGARKSAWPTC